MKEELTKVTRQQSDSVVEEMIKQERYIQEDMVNQRDASVWGQSYNLSNQIETFQKLHC